MDDIAEFDAALADADSALALPAEVALAVLEGRTHPLTAWRNAAGLSMAALAERAGVRKATVADIENNRIDPRLGTLRKIAHALGLKIADIVPEFEDA